jgi:hypothetical protein
MDRSLDADKTFFRVGEAPGLRPHMVSAPWSKCSTPLSDRMKPLYRDFYSDVAGRLKCGMWESSAGRVELLNSTADRVCFIV